MYAGISDPTIEAMARFCSTAMRFYRARKTASNTIQCWYRRCRRRAVQGKRVAMKVPSGVTVIRASKVPSLINTLHQGIHVYKFSRYFKTVPVERFIWLRKDGYRIEVSKTYIELEYRAGTLTKKGVALSEVHKVVSGCGTDVFKRWQRVTRVDPECCFSLVTSSRTHDFSFRDSKYGGSNGRDQLVAALRTFAFRMQKKRKPVELTLNS